MDARTFLGMEPDGDTLHWRMRVVPQLTTPGNFLFGGCGLGAALVALEAASGRPTVWATGHYLSYALTDAELVWEVTLAAVGGHVTQGRAVGSVDGREILTVNAALGKDDLAVGGVWVVPPQVPPPDQCPPRFLPEFFRNTIMDSVEVRSARGRSFEEMDGSPGSPDSALWARVPGHLTPSAATLAIFGDYVSGAVSQPLGRRAMGRSLDNTLRMVQLKPTEWVLCDIRMYAVVGGYGQGIGVPLVGGRGAPGHGQSVDRCAFVARGCGTPRLTPGCDDLSHSEAAKLSSWLALRPPETGADHPAGSRAAAVAVVAVLAAVAVFVVVEKFGHVLPDAPSHCRDPPRGYDHDLASRSDDDHDDDDDHDHDPAGRTWIRRRSSDCRR